MYKYFFAFLFTLYIIGCGSSSSKGKKVSESTQNNQGSSVQPSPNMQAHSVIHKIPAISQSQKEEFINAVNSARADTQDCGKKGIFGPAPALSWSDELYKSAYEHSRDMAINGVVEHQGTNKNSDWTAKDLKLGRGSYFYERAEHNGYIEYKVVEENVAGGTYFNTAQDVVEAWLESDGHCASLMNKEVKEFGMAHVKENTKYTHYWSQEFGARH